MDWRETDPNLWVLNLSGDVKIAVFKPIYDRQHWHFAVNSKDSTEGFVSRQSAQAAELEWAIAQIGAVKQQLDQAEYEAKAALEALQPQTSTRDKAER